MCQAIAVVRQARPEALEHLAVAVGELASAVRLLVAPDGPAAGASPGQGDRPGATSSPGEGLRRPEPDPAPIERIDITD